MKFKRPAMPVRGRAAGQRIRPFDGGRRGGYHRHGREKGSPITGRVAAGTEPAAEEDGRTGFSRLGRGGEIPARGERTGVECWM